MIGDPVRRRTPVQQCLAEKDESRLAEEDERTKAKGARMRTTAPPARNPARLALATVLLWLSATTATAQTTGVIEGTVVDASGDPLPAALVTVTGEGVREEAAADADGSYRIAGLAVGDYVVTAALPGFQMAEAQVSLGAAEAVALQLVLRDAWLIDTISVVAEEPRIFARNVVPEPMMRQQPTITSVTAVVDNLPGVSVQEGDAYGFDDWSSNVAVRGFQVTLSEAQIGTTIDGFPNGTSDYFSGAKANRFIDAMNLGGVEVSQGTADIASRSVEALGGTFNYRTDDPAAERTHTASATIGENRGKRFAMRVDTGPLFGRETRAWIAAARQEATDWVQGSARNEREHVAAKLVSSHGRVDLTSYVSYDDIHEDDYQRLYSDADFRANPRWDRLVGDWPGVPYLNQFYRPGWQTRRKNTLAYLRADWLFSEFGSLSAGAYFHSNWGRGDWLPPYIVDVVDDRGGPESELAGLAPVRGGEQLGLIRFVNRDGVAVGPTPGCESSYIFNFYGSGGPAVDPACHPGATAVQSYRHSHYGKDRLGVTLDEEWLATIGTAGSVLRAGIWYERSRRDLGRDWHRILDPTLNFEWHREAYWHQYEWNFPQDVMKWYLEETLYVGPFALTGGAKQFLVGVSREDQFAVSPTLKVDSDSDLLLSGGVTYETPPRGPRPVRRLRRELQGDQQHAARGSGPQPGSPRARDRLEHRCRHAVRRGAGRAEHHLVHHRLPEPHLLPGPADARRSRLPHPGRRRLLQRGRHRNERRRVVGHRADDRPDIVLHGPHLQRLGVHRNRRSAGRRQPGHRDRSRHHRGAGPPVGPVARPPGTPRRRSVRQVHVAPARQPDFGLVHRRLLAGGRPRHRLGRSVRRPAGNDGVLDRGQQPTRPGLPVRHRRERGLAGCSPDDLDDRDGVVLRGG